MQAAHARTACDQTYIKQFLAAISSLFINIGYKRKLT